MMPTYRRQRLRGRISLCLSLRPTVVRNLSRVRGDLFGKLGRLQAMRSLSLVLQPSPVISLSRRREVPFVKLERLRSRESLVLVLQRTRVITLCELRELLLRNVERLGISLGLLLHRALVTNLRRMREVRLANPHQSTSQKYRLRRPSKSRTRFLLKGVQHHQGSHRSLGAVSSRPPWHVIQCLLRLLTSGLVPVSQLHLL